MFLSFFHGNDCLFNFREADIDLKLANMDKEIAEWKNRIQVREAIAEKERQQRSQIFNEVCTFPNI